MQFTIPGRPVPKSRPRSGKGKVYTPARTREYEQAVRFTASASCQKPLQGEVWVAARFYFHDKKHGDIDNYIKSIFDGIQGVCFQDDRQVVVLEASINQTKGNERAEVEVGEI